MKLCLALFVPALLVAQVQPKVHPVMAHVDLLLAIQKGNWPAFREALKAGANPKLLSPRGISALHLCSLRPDGNRYAPFLLEGGALLDPTPGATSPMDWAVARLNAPMVELLLRRGVEPAAGLLHELGHTPEGFEFSRDLPLSGDAKPTIRLLLQAGLPLEGKDARGRTPFLRAVDDRRWDVAAGLIQEGAQLPASRGHELFRLAVQHAHPGLMQAMLARGVQPGPVEPLLAALKVSLGNSGGLASQVECLALLKGAGLPVFLPRQPSLLHALAQRYYQEGPSREEARALVLRLLDLGIPADVQDESGCTPLALAVEHTGRPLSGVFRLLLERGNPNLPDDHGVTPLLRAAKKEFDGTLVRECLARGGRLGARDKDGRGWLHYLAMGSGNVVLAKSLSPGPLDLDDKDAKGRTPLIQAVLSGNRPMVASLLTERVDLEHRDQEGVSALVASANSGYLSQMLLNAGAQADPPPGLTLPTALALAAKRGNSSLVTILLGRGADPNRADDAGVRPLERAIDARCEVCITALQGKGALWTGPMTATALVASIKNRNHSRFMELLAKAPTLDVLGADGRTPLMAAVAESSAAWMNALLAKGAKPNMQDREGNTALHHLVLHEPGIPGALALLKAVGANLEARNRRGESALGLAFRSRRYGLAEDLWKAGASLDSLMEPANAPGSLSFCNVTSFVMRVAMARGQDLNILEPCGKPPIFHALQQGYWDLVDQMLDRGARAGLLARNGRSLLHVASAQAPEALIQRLLTLGASLHGRDQDGETALSQSLVDGGAQRTAFLLRQGARPEEAFRGDMAAFKALLGKDPGAARAFLSSKEDAPGPWTYGALSAMVLQGDARALRQARVAGLDLAVKPNQAPELKALARRFAPEASRQAILEALRD